MQVRLWGVGNEPWGCGGDMDVRTYATEFRRFASYLTSHSGAPRLCRVACGANARDYAWTEGMMTLCKKSGGHGGGGGAAARFAMEVLTCNMHASLRCTSACVACASQ